MCPVSPQSSNTIADVNKRTSPITSFVPLFIIQAKRSSLDTIPISKKSAMPIEIPANNSINGFGLLPLTGGFGAFPLLTAFLVRQSLQFEIK
ncbi:hypothetical protein C2G38_2180697 [Gigaspora rosea]|uniref:Uncharacterized protein n=1 Tax=Gigaspora rosea TaxID=44941 RepID=A0A397VFX7_9GLOM|nr:hypothetical protein C2G38_2180697 [Gigaspora rosea]